MTTAAAAAPPVHRFEVRPREEIGDPAATSLLRDAKVLGVHVAAAKTARVYLVQADLSQSQRERIAANLLADPVTEVATIGATPASGGASLIEVHPLPGVMDPVAQSVRSAIRELAGADAAVATGWRYELSGVTPDQARRLAGRLLANTVIHAIHDKPFTPDSLPRGTPHEAPLRHIPLRELSDEQLRKLSREAHLFLSLEEMKAIQEEYRGLGREPTDIELETLAQTWSEHCVHKTLKSRITYRDDEATERQGDGGQGGRGSAAAQTHEGSRAGSDMSFEFTSSGTGSRSGERSSRSPRSRSTAPKLNFRGRPGHALNPDGSVTIDNLLKSTVAAATHELIADGVDWTLSVFVDNAGIIRFDDEHAVCVKVETHNHPSAIEPYGGAATGVGGCIRDIIGTGLAALPVANTDVFCVAFPGNWSAESAQQTAHRTSHLATEGEGGDSDLPLALPAGCLHPRRILTQVVAGVRDYGNRMGIPTVNGAVCFDDRYVGNPLVFCGCIGVMPADLVKGEAGEGDLIVALGGRTGRDGIHGATFSSAELTDTHADEFAHAVQIGNPIEEKRVLDAIMRARGGGGQTRPLFNAITDCGAGGFSSAIGEMGEKLGAEVHLERAPLKYEGLTYTEIWISEAQERMVLAVPEQNLAALQQICDEEHVELAVLGRFGTPPGRGGRELVLNYKGAEVGRLPMAFLHEGIPQPMREAVWRPAGTEAQKRAGTEQGARPTPREALLKLLAHPNIASKHWIVRQYDHEVRAGTIVKPLVGPRSRGPSDAAVIQPVAGSPKALAIACGLQTGLGDPARGGDPYHMALAAIDECVRNLVCTGANPGRIAILDNFCWPSCDDPESLAALVRAAEGCYDGAKAYRTPFISGKDSLNNQFTTEDGRKIRIPPTLLISGVGIIDDAAKCVTMDMKGRGNHLYLCEPYEDGEGGAPNGVRLGGSHYEGLFGLPGDGSASAQMPYVDLEWCPRVARAIAEAIRLGLVASCHDVSDGGALCAVAEMLIAGSTAGYPIGATFTLIDPEIPRAFGERPGAYIVEVAPEHHGKFFQLMETRDVALTRLGETTEDGALAIEGDHDERVDVEELAAVWRGALDW